jgi:hypothetical protein
MSGGRSAAEKERVQPGSRIALLNPLQEVVDALGLPADVRHVDAADAELVFLFVQERAELEQQMPAAVARLAPGAALWVCFRKGSKSAGLDMSRDDVWRVAEQLQLRPLGLVSVNAGWSAFRLRR